MAKALTPLSMDVEAAGLDKARIALSTFAAKAPGAFAGGVYMAAVNIMSTAMKLTPVRTGWLRGSRYVTKPTMAGERFDITLGFGASYAVAVHEIPKPYRVGEYRFLVTATNWHAPTLLNEIAALTGRLIQAGKTIDDVPTEMPTAPPQGPEPRTKGTFLKELRHYNPDSYEGAAARRWAWEKRRRQQTRHSAVYANDVAKNKARMVRETQASLAAQRAGVRAPRPGRR